VPYYALVAQDGALVRFEDRVRAGTWDTRPVRLTLERRRWRVTSTGTVTAQRLGPAPKNGWGQLGGRTARAVAPKDGWTANPDVPLSSAEAGSATGPEPTGDAWGAVPPGRQQATEPDVYFTLAETGDAGGLGIGLWATDVCVAFGQSLGATPNAAGLSVAERDAPDARPAAP
jgi:hypothetical protein